MSLSWSCVLLLRWILLVLILWLRRGKLTKRLHWWISTILDW